MRKFFLVVGVSSLSLASFCSAQAADAVRRNHNHALVPTHSRHVVLCQDWSGLYVGLAGKAALNQQGFSDERDKADGADRKYKDHVSVGPALFGGFNMQDDALVYGGEANGNWLFGLGDDASVRAAKTPETAKMDGPSLSLVGRVGYEVMDPVLVFVNGGLSLAIETYTTTKKVENKDVDNTEYKPSVGFTVGTGVDVMLFDGLSGRVGYNFNYYPSVKNTKNNMQHALYVGVAMKL